MKESDAARLLALAAAFDQRKVGPEDIAAWADALADLGMEECAQAIREHYAEETKRVMPAHVRSAVKAARKARRSDPGPPPECSNPDCGQPYRHGKEPAPGERCVRCHWPLVLRQAYTARCPGGEACLCERNPCPPGLGVAYVAYRPYDAVVGG